MFKLGKYRKKQNCSALLKLATTPATINVSMLIETAGEVIYRYLYAVNNRRPDLLPADSMEESFYYHTLDRMSEISECNLQKAVKLNTIQLYDYDCKVMYTVQSITYHAACTFNQTDLDFYATVRRDERMGWLLEHSEADEVKAGC